MKLLIQPDDGAAPIIEAINKAKKSVEIAIFRCDHPELERALVDAVKRGVAVQALIAFSNRGGEKRLRALEMRLLGAGAVVARTSDDLVKYHGKYLLVDRAKVYILAFNFTKADVRLTRSFGIVSSNPKLVQETVKLFLADSTRKEYASGWHGLIVSPVNARKRLMDFIGKAKRQLLIYDLEISDPQMLELLKERVAAGVELRVIGSMAGKDGLGDVRKSNPLRLHARAIIRDNDSVFLGSQSLRRMELDMRREVGLVVRGGTIPPKMAKLFEGDWESAKGDQVPAEKVARKVAKAVARELGSITPMLDQVVAQNGGTLDMDRGDIEDAVKNAVKTAVRDVVHEAVSNPANTK